MFTLRIIMLKIPWIMCNRQDKMTDLKKKKIVRRKGKKDREKKGKKDRKKKKERKN